MQCRLLFPSSIVDKKLPKIVLKLPCLSLDLYGGRPFRTSLPSELRGDASLAVVSRDFVSQGPAPRVGILGWLGHDHVTPRGLSSRKVNRLVCVEGVVNRCTAVQPKLCRAVYVSEPQGGGAAGHVAGGGGGGRQDVDGGEASQERQVYVRAFYDITNLDKDIRDTQAPPERGNQLKKATRTACL